jgi:hypothetical protein
MGIVYLNSPYQAACFEFFKDINTFNNFMLILFGIRIALIFAFIGIFLICCLPCLCVVIVGAIANSQQREQLKRTVVQGLSKTTFDHLTDRVNKECSICLCDFTDEDEVTPLPCSTKHYFHSICIEDWLKVNNVCPLCKTEIKPDQLDKLRDELRAN